MFGNGPHSSTYSVDQKCCPGAQTKDLAWHHGQGSHGTWKVLGKIGCPVKVLEFGENTGGPGILLSEVKSSGNQDHGRAIFMVAFDVIIYRQHPPQSIVVTMAVFQFAIYVLPKPLCLMQYCISFVSEIHRTVYGFQFVLNWVDLMAQRRGGGHLNVLAAES